MTTLVSHSLCFHAIFRTLQWHQSFCSFSEDDDSKIKNKILFALVSLCPVVFHLLYKFRKILITIFQRTQRQIQVIIGSWIGIGSTSIVGCWACHWGDLRGNHRWGVFHPNFLKQFFESVDRACERSEQARERWILNIEYWISKQQKSNYAPHVRDTTSGRDSKVVKRKRLHEESAVQIDLGRKNRLRACCPAWGQIRAHFLHSTFWAWQSCNHAPRRQLERVTSYLNFEFWVLCKFLGPDTAAPAV